MSVAGATLVGAASLLVGASAVQHVLTSVDGLSSPDGFQRILSPAIIATGLVAGGLASAAQVGSWRATKSRGLRHGSAVMAGVLLVCRRPSCMRASHGLIACCQPLVDDDLEEDALD